MANNRSSFGLSNLRDGIEEKTSELSEDAQSRATDGSFLDRNKPFTYEQEEYDRTEAPRDDMRTYWRQFETTPIVRKPITSFASRVTEPGYYIETQRLDQETVTELGEWLDSCAIVEGQPGKGFRELAKKAVVQREVRGTALVEKAPHKEDEEKIAGLKLINPETVEAVTLPDKSILMPPDAMNGKYEEAPDAESSGVAAWQQDILETDQTYFRENYSDEEGNVKIGFRRDEVIPLRRDADVGEIFGTSRLESVSKRIDGLKDKLDDNDQAIASKAYPLYVFLFGDPETEEGVWDSDDIQDFMSAHEMQNFEPGMKQGVRGDVGIETVSGEVADIAEYLQFDIQWIMSSMPMPMFLLGSFSDASVGQVAGVAQQQDLLRQIEDARRELEEEFTPTLREVAMQMGVSEEDAQDIKLRFGNPGQPDPEVARSQQTIQYVSDANSGQNTQQPGQQTRGGQQQGQPAAPSDQPQTGSPKGDTQRQQDGVVTKGETPSSVNKYGATDQPIAGTAKDGNPYSDSVGDPSAEAASQLSGRHGKLWDEEGSVAELKSQPSLNQSTLDELAKEIEHEIRSVRDNILKEVGRRYSNDKNRAVVNFSRVANRETDNSIGGSNLSRHTKRIMAEDVESIQDEYTLDTSPHTSVGNTRFFAQNVVNSVSDSIEQMTRYMRVHVRNGAASGEPWANVRDRIEDKFSDSLITDKSRLIAQMELKNAIESTKLQTFAQVEDIVGVRVNNPTAQTSVTKKLDGEEAYFDEGEIDSQLSDSVNESDLQTGFDPLPPTPPYHYNDTSTLEPIYKDEE